MKKFIYHSVRLFRKYWFYLCMAFAMSPFFFLIVFAIAITISLLFFDNMPEVKDITEYLTEEELRKIETAEEVNDEEYLSILAKWQSYNCPVKVDQITTWTGSQLTEDAFICNYEINDKRHRYGKIDMNVLKDNVMSRLDKGSDRLQRIVATNRNLIYRYWNKQTNTTEDIVFTSQELNA